MPKENLVCPACGKIAHFELDGSHYKCVCGWDSLVNTADISYKDERTAALSNLFPHKFNFYGVTCLSMESFIQSLREKDAKTQFSICSDYSGLMAYKMRLCLRDWRGSGYVYWAGQRIDRFSKEYDSLISNAYNALLSGNNVFQEILRRHKGMYLIHSIGCDDKKETLLTELEYRAQLNRMQNLL